MANEFVVHLIVPDDAGLIPGSQDPLFAAPGRPKAYRVLCDAKIGQPRGMEHALTNHPPAASCELCKAEFRRTLRAPDRPEREPLPPTPPIEPSELTITGE